MKSLKFVVGERVKPLSATGVRKVCGKNARCKDDIAKSVRGKNVRGKNDIAKSVRGKNVRGKNDIAKSVRGKNVRDENARAKMVKSTIGKNVRAIKAALSVKFSV